MDVVGQFAGGIAHDFNNFLQVLNMRMELLQQKLRGQNLEDDLTVIRRGVRRGQSLIQHLLSFSGHRSFQTQTIDLRQLLPEWLDFVRSTAGAKITVHLSVDAETPAIVVNASELEASVLNLIVNARDAMPTGGPVQVRATGLILAQGNQHHLPPGSYAELSVADAGGGIAPDILPRVFDPFFTTKPAGKGTGLGLGLGLAQVYGFAHRQGGTAHIASEQGRGATVYIILPGTAHSTEENGNPPDPAQAYFKGGSVLVVDDNKAVGESSRALLEQLGYAVVLADSADQALAMLSDGLFKPAIVLSDIVIPGSMDGIGMARVLRVKRPGLAIVLATGYSRDDDAALRREFRVLRKPYSMRELQEAILAAQATMV